MISPLSTAYAVLPRVLPPLDPAFRPAALVSRAAADIIRDSGHATELVLGLEREDGRVSVHRAVAFAADSEFSGSELRYVERLVKFLLWQRGAFRLHIGGPRHLGEQLAALYSATGARAFDADFLGNNVYERPFELRLCTAEDVPAAHDPTLPAGRHLDGYRIGFDLGASDRKVSAVVDGESVFSEEVVWEPRQHADPDYHYQEVLTALKTAAAHLPRVDAIGGSSAGIYIDNRPMVASLFRAVPPERFQEVRTMFQRLQEEFRVPFTVINDGDVTALAGSMALEENSILGVALGSSEAAGYVAADGNLTGWLNELAFAPLDYASDAPLEAWSGDRGVGASYLSQQCVFRLAERAGIVLPEAVSDAARLESVQEKLEAGHEGAVKIWQTMGVYLGYAIAHYADFYDIAHVLILGRCTSGCGGTLLLEGAREVLSTEFPDLARRIALQLPDEKTRRVGQSVAAASLPALEKK